MDKPALKNLRCAQVARVGKALASTKRLEMLAQAKRGEVVMPHKTFDGVSEWQAAGLPVTRA